MYPEIEPTLYYGTKCDGLQAWTTGMSEAAQVGIGRQRVDAVTYDSLRDEVYPSHENPIYKSRRYGTLNETLLQGRGGTSH